MRGDLIETEHLARYKWATTMLSGGRILDAGCGVAYGTCILARSEATEVIGVDIAEAVLDAVRPDMPENVRLEVGDVRDLRYDDGSFDAVVCFECLEHLVDPSPALDELARVLVSDGVFLASSPNRNVYPPTNPHHHHEFLPQELAAELGRRFRNVRLVRQQDYAASIILTDEAFIADSDKPLDDVHLYKTVGGSADRETFTLGLASDGQLPTQHILGMVTPMVEVTDTLSFYLEQEEALRRHREYIYELEQQLADHRELQLRLLEVGQGTFAGDAQEEIKELTARLDGTRRILDDVLSSPSWRLGAPLRALKQRLNTVRQVVPPLNRRQAAQ
jgi:SAM-dependent methyltransferase